MSPAGATVLGDVLVASGADVVDAADISPIPGLWQIRNVQILVRTSSRPAKEGGFLSSCLQQKNVRNFFTISTSVIVYNGVLWTSGY